MRGTFGGAIVAALLAGLPASPSQAQIVYSPADQAALRGYALTVDKLNRYISAAAALQKAQRSNPALRREAHADDSDDTIPGDLAALKRRPNLAALFHKEGLSDQDIVLFPLVIVYAARAAGDPKAAATVPVTPAQVAFYKAHAKEIAQIDLD